MTVGSRLVRNIDSQGFPGPSTCTSNLLTLEKREFKQKCEMDIPLQSWQQSRGTRTQLQHPVRLYLRRARGHSWPPGRGVSQKKHLALFVASQRVGSLENYYDCGDDRRGAHTPTIRLDPLEDVVPLLHAQHSPERFHCLRVTENG